MRRLLLALPFCLCLALPAGAEPTGATLLTVTGTISETNRPPYDAFEDTLLRHFVEPFEQAYAFDRAMLQALPQESLALAYPNWQGRSVTLTGPRLAAVLEAVGATGEGVSVAAVDGYAVVLERARVEAGPFLLALEMDGKPLAFGGRGPLWLVFPPGADPQFEGQDDAGLVWAVVHIGVE